MLYSFVFHCDFSNPNRITKRSKSRNRRLCDFCDTAMRRKLAFVSDAVSQKTASAPAECRFASVSMMARGGREKASQRLNPSRKTIIICPTFVRYVMQEIALIQAGLDYSHLSVLSFHKYRARIASMIESKRILMVL